MVRTTQWGRLFVVLAITVSSTGGGALAAFQPGTLVVLRIDYLQAAPSDSARQIFLDEYDSVTGEHIASHPVPSTGKSSLTLGGAGEHDGHVNVSSNGRYIIFAGYRAEVDDDNPVSQFPAEVPRVIGRMDSAWNVDTSTALGDAYDRTDITAVASDNGKRFWTSGEGKYLDLVNGRVEDDFKVPTITGGLRFVSSLGAATSVNVSQTQTIPADLDNDDWPDSIRSCRIVGDQVYISTPAPESFGYRGAYATTDPLPTSGAQTMIPVITNAPPSTDTSGKFVPKSDVILLDLSELVPGIDTAYSTGGKADYQKWALVNTAWVRIANESLVNTSEEINALGAVVSEEGVILFASTDQGVYRLNDTAGYNADISETFTDALVEAASDTAFRGFALVADVCSPDGDANVDGHMDLADVALLQRCFSGAEPFDGSPGCTLLDSDCDGDVDVLDGAALDEIVAGP